MTPTEALAAVRNCARELDAQAKDTTGIHEAITQLEVVLIEVGQIDTPANDQADMPGEPVELPPGVVETPPVAEDPPEDPTITEPGPVPSTAEQAQAVPPGEADVPAPEGEPAPAEGDAPADTPSA